MMEVVVRNFIFIACFPLEPEIQFLTIIQILIMQKKYIRYLVHRFIFIIFLMISKSIIILTLTLMSL